MPHENSFVFLVVIITPFPFCFSHDTHIIHTHTHTTQHTNKQTNKNRVQRAEFALRPGWSALLVALHQLLRQASASSTTTTPTSSGGGASRGATTTTNNNNSTNSHSPPPSSLSSSPPSLYSQMLLTAFHEEYAGREGAGGVLGCLPSVGESDFLPLVGEDEGLICALLLV
jgi:hypothetical protein